jgi:hypothetical protein
MFEVAISNANSVLMRRDRRMTARLCHVGEKVRGTSGYHRSNQADGLGRLPE